MIASRVACPARRMLSETLIGMLIGMLSAILIGILIEMLAVVLVRHRCDAGCGPNSVVLTEILTEILAVSIGTSKASPDQQCGGNELRICSVCCAVFSGKSLTLIQSLKQRV